MCVCVCVCAFVHAKKLHQHEKTEVKRDRPRTVSHRDRDVHFSFVGLYQSIGNVFPWRVWSCSSWTISSTNKHSPLLSVATENPKLS